MEITSFLFKLTIVYDIYAKANIPQKILLKVFLIILTILALNYYYLNIRISISAIFDKVCELIEISFKRAKYKKNIWSK